MDIFYFHILPRLPAKSIIRFLFACKQWQSFLTTPQFTKLYHHHHHQKQLLIVFSTKTPCKFQTIDCESPEHGLSTVSRPLPFKVASPKNMSIVASTRGVVCVRIINNCNGNEYSDIILWNPLTGEHKTLSKPNNNNEECLVTHARVFGLYYTCNDYKILLVTHNPDVYIYSSKFDSWRKVEMTQEEFRIFTDLHWVWTCWKQPCVLLNEKICFLIQRVEPEVMVSYSIIRFDLITEKWRKISAPFYGSHVPSRYVSFTVVKGCIHLWMRYYTDDFPIVLWRMDGDGDRDWTNVVT